MALHLVIDGYNFIGPGSFGATDIEEAREDLITSLITYRKVRRIRVTVVFDGTGSGNLARSEESRDGVKVRFSKGGEEADVILKELARAGHGSVTMVTDDRDVAGYARAVGSVVVSRAEFATLMDDAMYEAFKGAAPDEDDYGQNTGKKGPSRRPPKDERKKKNRIKKL